MLKIEALIDQSDLAFVGFDQIVSN